MQSAWRTRLLNFNLLVFGAIQVFLFALLPQIIDKTDLASSSVMLAFSLGTLLFVPGSLIASKLALRIGPEKVLFVNGLGVLLSLLSTMYLFESDLSHLGIMLFGRFSHGLIAGGLPAVSQMLRLQYSHEKMRSMMGHSVALNLGRLLGPSLFLFPFGVKLQLFILITLALLLLLMNMALMLRSDTKISAQGERASFELSALPALGLAFSFTVIVGVLHAGLGEHLRPLFNLSAEGASGLMARLLLIGALVMVMVQLLGKKIKDHQWRETLLTSGLCFAGGAAILALSSQLMGLYIGMVTFSFGLSLLGPSSVLYLAHLTGDETKNLGLLSSSTTLGSAAGGALMGFAPGSLSQLLTLLALVFSIFCLRSVSAKKRSLCCQ
jgi:MFS family permease